jgi:hypothetical protein
MREIRTSGSMSGDGKRRHGVDRGTGVLRKQPDQQLPTPVMTAPVFDSTATSNEARRDASALRMVHLFPDGPLGDRGV